jgi:hypothetical protein
MSHPSDSACKINGSPDAQTVGGTNHHAVSLPAKATKIMGAGNTPGNLTLTLLAHGTLARYYATSEIDTQGVVFAMRAQCHAVASNGVDITFPHTSAVVVPLMSYHVFTLAKVTHIGAMAKY